MAIRYLTIPETIFIQLAMQVYIKQYTFRKMGSIWSKVYDLPSLKSWGASVDGSEKSSEKPVSTRANKAK